MVSTVPLPIRCSGLLKMYSFMQTVAELIEDLKKLPPDHIVDVQVGHTFQFRHFAKSSKPINGADETIIAEQGD